MRFNRYLSVCGVASRRKSEELIRAGRVTVNGERVKELGIQIDENTDVVLVDGKQIKPVLKKEYYIVYKPKGVISAAVSKYGEKTVVDLIDSQARLFPVGRLDKETTGLLLVTNDGELAYRMTHPRFEKQKTYEVLIRGGLDVKQEQMLRRGILLDGKRTAPAKLRLLRKKREYALYEITLTEGRNRQVRLMFQAVGRTVLELKRTKESFLTLEGLQEGEYRKLTNKEIRKLQEE